MTNRCTAVSANDRLCTLPLDHDGHHVWQMFETINHPQHYGGDTTYEAIKVIEAWGLGFHLGNAIKYICRAGSKGTELEDLKKARWYLDRYIQQLEKGTKT